MEVCGGFGEDVEAAPFGGRRKVVEVFFDFWDVFVA
jgi:hypothetical protein